MSLNSDLLKPVILKTHTPVITSMFSSSIKHTFSSSLEEEKVKYKRITNVQYQNPKNILALNLELEYC